MSHNTMACTGGRQCVIIRWLAVREDSNYALGDLSCLLEQHSPHNYYGFSLLLGNKKIPFFIILLLQKLPYVTPWFGY